MEHRVSSYVMIGRRNVKRQQMDSCCVRLGLFSSTPHPGGAVTLNQGVQPKLLDKC